MTDDAMRRSAPGVEADYNVWYAGAGSVATTSERRRDSWIRPH